MTCKDTFPVYFGTTSDEVPTDVQSFPSVMQATKHGSWTFNPNGEYMVVAMPQAFGFHPYFKLHPFNLSMVVTEQTLTVDGVSVPYYVYRSPEKSFGQDIVLVID